MPSYQPSHNVLSSRRATVGALFHSRVPANPSQRAVVEGARVLSYLELEERSNRLANALLDTGLAHGDRIGLLSRNCLEYMEVELAAAKAGLILACLNWRLGDRELRHCITLVEPKVIIAQADLTESLDRVDLPLHQRITMGAEYENFMAAASDNYPDLDIDPEDGLVILYTSGTTGLPKGALVSHRAMVARGMCFTSEFEVPIGDNFCAWPPFYHMASTDQALGTLLRGGAVHVVDGYEPDRLIEVLEHEKMHFFILMPGMVRPFTEILKARNVRIKGVNICGAMADLVPREDIAAATLAFDAPYNNSFGATETGMPPASSNLIPIGVTPTNLSKRQSAFCDLRLVDPDDNEVPVGTPGEVALRGPTLFSGYWNADKTNAEDFRNGWFHMGDVLRRNEDGTLDYVDRVKYMIKSGGENIYPAEIEQVMLADARVHEAVVVRRPDRKWSEVPVVFVVPADPALTADDLMDLCKKNLSSYKRPKDIFFVAEADLPRSTTGKVQRHELEARVPAA
ncbi:MAG: AMP-binding protein [Alphaproteobacteria bacterium]|nr:acid--CoA ligase [Rhodospirillaceae bacterium]MDP6020779.1 AMP-binding protein [Alphaproteobacteria bacterium]MDP6256706.1 AMP-binding protein [Alphaproteobacteria bacterium]MDP7056406.1 AMP-binding protein [Alphaproteobacteria bacterium]MDP7230226.1 AMP-binding protein [Alphaproteobacteria bacterium]